MCSEISAGRQVMGSEFYQASYSGGVLMISPCFAVNVTTLPMRIPAACTVEVPVRYELDGAKVLGFLQTSDNRYFGV